MTFEEIFKSGNEGKIGTFKAYDLLEERSEEISHIIISDLKKYNKNTKAYKELQGEKDSCIRLKNHIIKSVFDDVALGIFAEKAEFGESSKFEGEQASAYFETLMSDMFFYEKAKKENDEELADDFYKKALKKQIIQTIDLLKELNEGI